MDNTFFTIILGSFIGFLSTLVSSQYVAKRNQKSKEKSLKISINLELDETVNILDEIKSKQNIQGFYDFTLLDTLDKNVTNLESTKKTIHLISAEALQKDIYKVIGKLSRLSASMRSTQNYAFSDDPIDEGELLNKSKFIEKNIT